jgi:D-alanine--poly(phosphoribitol) ligase subunit 2
MAVLSIVKSFDFIYYFELTGTKPTMNIDSKAIEQIIFKCIEELNRQLSPESKLQNSLDAILVGEGGALDSLGLITLIVSLEEAVQEETGICMALLEEELLVDSEGPFHTVGSIVNWIISKLD